MNPIYSKNIKEYIKISVYIYYSLCSLENGWTAGEYIQAVLLWPILLQRPHLNVIFDDSVAGICLFFCLLPGGTLKSGGLIICDLILSGTIQESVCPTRCICLSYVFSQDSFKYQCEQKLDFLMFLFLIAAIACMHGNSSN